MSGKLVVLVTCANARQAGRIARALVDERLAACVNLQRAPVVSIYRWKGKVERASEILLIAKTTAPLFPKLEGRVRQLHSYKTPEIIAVPIARGSRAYLAWIDESLRPNRLGRRER